MDAIHRTFRPWTSVATPRCGPCSPLAESIALTLAAGLFLFAVFVFARRFGGAFESSLGGAAFITSIAGAVLWAAAIRVVTCKADDKSAPKWVRRFVEWTPTVALPLTGVALATDGTPLSAVLIAAALITGEEYWAARFTSLPSVIAGRRGSSRLVVGRKAEARLDTRASAVEVVSEADEAAVAIDAEVHGDLWLEQRRFIGECSETISGVLRSRLLPRDRVAIEHIAFCPPMPAMPHLELEPVDGCDYSVRATHVHRYGARIEVKLEQVRDEATECLVAFEARAAIGGPEQTPRTISNR
jgi:hypothetical protein